MKTNPVFRCQKILGLKYLCIDEKSKVGCFCMWVCEHIQTISGIGGVQRPSCSEHLPEQTPGVMGLDLLLPWWKSNMRYLTPVPHVIDLQLVTKLCSQPRFVHVVAVKLTFMLLSFTSRFKFDWNYHKKCSQILCLFSEVLIKYNL